MRFISIVNYYKKLKGKYVLEDINLEFERGQIYGVQGHNGCGKTMLLRAIAGLITATSGYVRINGQELKKEIDFPPSIGVLIENPEFWKYKTGFETLKMLAEIKKSIGEKEISDVLDRVGLEEVKNVPVGKYSLGMRQRLGIAQAIMEKPDIILLDEPTNALDKEGCGRFNKIIMEEKSRNAVIVIVSHNGESLQSYSDAIISMENGRIDAVGRIAK